jgi:hypothetical protein
MADKKITELNNATLPLDGTEQIPIVQNGETKKVVSYVFLSNFNSDSLTQSINGTYNIDWNEYSNWDLTLTGNTTLTQTNIPTTATEKTITIYVQGDYALTLPNEWIIANIENYDTQDGSKIVVQSWNNGSFNANIYNIAKPYLYIVEPSIARVNTTFNVILIGLDFTPNTTVSISGQTINNVEFITPTQLKVNITTGSAEGMKNITINNGFSRVFDDVFETTFGDVYIPKSNDWYDVTGIPNISVDGEIRITQANVQGTAKWLTIPINKDFKIEFRLVKSPLGTSKTGVSLPIIQLFNNQDIQKYNFNFYLNGVNNSDNRVYCGDEIAGFLWNNTLGSLTQTYDLDDESKFTIERNSQVVKYYSDINSIIRVSTLPSNEELYLKIPVQWWDIINIRYIEFD